MNTFNTQLRKHKDSLTAVIIFAILIYFKLEFINIPLHEDEEYYAQAGVFKSFLQWTFISFGHPPGWNLINGIVFAFVGNSPIIAHTIALVISSLSVSLIFYIPRDMWDYTTRFYAATTFFAIDYFSYAMTISHPVIFCATLGLLSLLSLERKNHLQFAILSTAAIMLRESALVYVVAAILINRDKKTMKFSLVPTLSLAFFYVCFFIARKELMLNGHVQSVVKNSKPFLIFSWDYFQSFYSIYLLGNFSKIFLVVIIAGLLFILIKRKSLTKLEGMLLLVFIFHSLFFALYLDRAQRLTFISLSALGLLTASFLHYFKARFKRIAFPILMICSLSFIYYSYSLTSSKMFAIRVFRTEVTMYQELHNYLKGIKEKHKGITFVSTNPITMYFNNPGIGIVSSPFGVIWYGGVEGESQLPEADIVIIPMNFNEGFPSRDMKELVKEKDYKLIKVFTSEHQLIIHVYGKTKIIK